MNNVVVIGSQWGDEGKGKIVDWLSQEADIVVRFQGGHNAGHTLVIDGEIYKLSLLPSGIVRAGKKSIIANGVVVDPWALLDEIERLRKQGVEISPENLLIAENVTLILPIHSALDAARERARGDQKIGTTGRGIGPAYEDKVARRAIRLCDLSDPAFLEDRIDELLMHHNALLKGMGEGPVDRQDLINRLLAIAPKILPYSGVVWPILENARKEGKMVLFEGAQGVMLDIDHGTYPFVTSSNTCAGQSATGSGVGPKSAQYVLGITKAYTTRVGSGPFPTELKDEIGQGLGNRGHEFGTVTGRKRRCGWFDATMVHQACKISGMDGIALTKIDVLDGLSEIKICIGYEFDGKKYDYLPAATILQAKVKPIYETMPGWSEKTYGLRNWGDLPDAAIKYIHRIEELIETKIAIVSTSPEREDTIMKFDPLKENNISN